jgi:hypothetical protein
VSSGLFVATNETHANVSDCISAESILPKSGADLADKGYVGSE